MAVVLNSAGLQRSVCVFQSGRDPRVRSTRRLIGGAGRPLVVRPASCLIVGASWCCGADGQTGTGWAYGSGMDVVTLLADRLQLHDAMRAPQQRLTDDSNEVCLPTNSVTLPV